MIFPAKKIDDRRITFLVFALLPASLVILSLLSARAQHLSREMVSAVFILTIVSLVGTLLRLYMSTLRSKHAGALTSARTHILLHVIALMALIVYQFTAPSGWTRFALLSAILLFFASGRVAWMTMKKLIPTTKMYVLFYRGNSSMLLLLPCLYLGSLIAPGLVSFGALERVLVVYFAIHFIIVGIACWRIDADIHALDAKESQIFPLH